MEDDSGLLRKELKSGGVMLVYLYLFKLLATLVIIKFRTHDAPIRDY